MNYYLADTSIKPFEKLRLKVDFDGSRRLCNEPSKIVQTNGLQLQTKNAVNNKLSSLLSGAMEKSFRAEIHPLNV